METKLILPTEFVPGTVKPEADYIEMQRLGQKLGIPVPQMHLMVESADGNGKIIGQHAGRSRTFNRNFWNILFGTLTQPPAGTATFAAGFLALKNNGSAVVARNYAIGTEGIDFIAAAGSGSGGVGIQVGTGNTAESFEAFNLTSAISAGSTAGKLNYDAATPTVATYNSGSKVWSAAIKRVMHNNSPGTITVAEIGLIVKALSDSFTFMVQRDLLPTPLAVIVGGTITVTYTLTMTFPA